MLTPTALSQLEYDKESLQVSGFTDADYTDQYAIHGWRVNWWKAYNAAPGVKGISGELRHNTGFVYELQSRDDARCMFYSTSQSILDPTFGLIKVGATGISVLPGEASNKIELARDDRIASPDVTYIARSIMTRGDIEDFTQLVQRPVKAITGIWLQGSGNRTPVAPESYTLASNGITWNDTTGVPYGSTFNVEYRYMPIFTWLQVNDQGVIQRTQDNAKLPQRGTVVQIHMTDYEQF